MIIRVLGVQRITGRSKRPPNDPYDFARVLVVQPITSRSGESYSVQGAGFEVQEMACDPAAVIHMPTSGYPQELDLITEARPTRSGRGYEVWVTGVRSQTQQQANT